MPIEALNALYLWHLKGFMLICNLQLYDIHNRSYSKKADGILNMNIKTKLSIIYISSLIIPSKVEDTE